MAIHTGRLPASHRAGRWRAVALALLLLGTLVKGTLWALLIFPLDSPDEPSHFNYIMQVRATGALPVVVMPTSTTLRIPPSTPQDPATTTMLRFFGYLIGSNAFFGLPYESTQPPLFYGVAAAVLAPLGDDRLELLFAARMVAVLFGVGTIGALWWAVRALWPDCLLLIWGVPLALTLHPQFTFVTSAVTNDAALLFFGALLFAVWAAGLRALAGGQAGALWRWGVLAGIVTGLGMLSKLTMAFTLPATLLWLWWLAASEQGVGRRARAALPALLAGGGVLAVLVGPWVVRNLQIYGEPSGTQAMFDLYHTMALHNYGLPADQVLIPVPPGRFLLIVYLSFWAVYSWLTTTIEPWTYLGTLVLTLSA